MQFLVTAANGNIAEAIAGILREEFPYAGVHGVDAVGGWPGEAIFDSVQKIPWAADDDYPDALHQAARQVGATLIIPSNDREILRLSNEPAQAGELPLLILRADLARTFCDKLETAEWLKAHNFISPRTVALTQASELDLPLIVKPRLGSGSFNVSHVRTKSRLRGLQEEYGDDYVAQTYLPDVESEMTCALLRLNGDFRMIALQRKLGGDRTISAKVVDEPAVNDLLRGIAEAADLHGAINVQLRLTPEGPMIFEINPRFSSTVKMHHMLGFKDLVWAIKGLDGSALPEYKPQTGATVYRLSREITDLKSGIDPLATPANLVSLADDLRLRSMQEGDLADVLRWRNADVVRSKMLNDHVISFEEHAAWFKRSCLDPSCDWQIAEYRNRPIGVAGLTDINRDHGTATWSMYLADDAGVAGVGAFIELKAIDRLFDYHNIRKIWGEALADNIAMLRLHKKFGFHQEGIFERHVCHGSDPINVVRIALFREDWPAARERVIRQLTPARPQKGGVI